jgi:hypothetical protein
VIAPDLHWLSVSVLLVTTLELILGVIVAILGPNTDYTVTVYIVIPIFKLLVAKTASDAAQTYQFSTLRNGAIGSGLITLFYFVGTISWISLLVYIFQVDNGMLWILYIPLVILTLNLTVFVLLFVSFIKHAKIAHKGVTRLSNEDVEAREQMQQLNTL